MTLRIAPVPPHEAVADEQACRPQPLRQKGGAGAVHSGDDERRRVIADRGLSHIEKSEHLQNVYSVLVLTGSRTVKVSNG